MKKELIKSIAEKCYMVEILRSNSDYDTKRLEVKDEAIEKVED